MSNNNEKSNLINQPKINKEEEINTNLVNENKNELKKVKNDQKEEPLYIMNLELEKGKPEKLLIYANCDPIKIASNFCKEHNLDYNGLDYLTKKIQ